MFHQQEQLKGQLQDSHIANRQLGFHCQECGKQYNTQLGYRRHLVEAHSAGAGLPCSEGTPSLLEHLGAGHIDRPPPAEGNTNAVVAVRERKYSCERCDRRFYTRKDVRRHAVVHTGRRDFLCPRCAQRFGRRDHLTRHLKKSHVHDAGLIPLVTASTPVATSTTTTQCPIKESSPLASDRSSTASKEPVETYTRDMFNSYPITNPVPGMSHPHGLMQVSLSSSMSVGRHMPPPSPHNHHHHLQPLSAPPQQQSYGSMPRYQQGSTSYPRTDVDSFLLDLQGAPPPHLSSVNSSTSTSTSPQREMLAEGMPVGSDPHLVPRNAAISSAELSCTTNMELGPLLGFLPFSLPPYSSHVGMGGLMMGYPPATTATSSPTSSSGLSSQASGPFTFFQPSQAHVPQGPVAHNHSQLPQAYSTSAVSTSSSLPHYYQAFQQ
ncbi:zinc finger protein PLAGL2-like [Syngnathus acus]|uniref:zinc finger protein PLAGL2-like n=1 Tax=Syngnathus acus TaxID=161584 RepID=UPI001885E0DC|nr:zinc finger protein PLAGL2-like [Syngnathus acus]